MHFQTQPLFLDATHALPDAQVKGFSKTHLVHFQTHPMHDTSIQGRMRWPNLKVALVNDHFCNFLIFYRFLFSVSLYIYGLCRTFFIIKIYTAFYIKLTLPT
ncbi:hypothetical protein HanRHA438_Chr16g0748811 [Helianthus annuus]|nr:hypothetical protein HanRHA438_Chr16g0748811 [Helianthus annuus]